MANKNEGLERRERMPDSTSRKLEAGCRLIYRFFMGLIIFNLSSFFTKAYDIVRSEPKKAIHCLKVGLCIFIVSLFYYTRPLYEGVGGNAMWAIITVVVVFEYIAGQMLAKCINRVTATFLGGSLGVGVHWVVTQCGPMYEPVIMGYFVFLLASAVTFSRFIPTIKTRFDYGAMIFILTFSLVSVSGYHVEELVELALDRVWTVAIGTAICIIIGLVCFPVWAGSELHLLIHTNMDKLADSLDGYVEKYFYEIENEKPNKEDTNKKLQGYTCVLNSKGTEDSLANYARWEPAHGTFNFRHPWKQYLKIGEQMRRCACCIESLATCSELEAPEFLKRSFSESCKRLSSQCSKVLKDSAETIKTMAKSSTVDFSVGEMNFAVQELQNTIKSLPQELLSKNRSLIDVFPLVTAVTSLIEIAKKIKGIVDAIDELADLAEFKLATDGKSTGDETMKVFQKI